MRYDVPHGLMFHHFWDQKHVNGQGAITADQFEKLIVRYLESHHILKARDWMERAQSGTLEARDICLTFDDALLCQYDIALPVMQQHDLTAFWFVYTSVVTGGVEMLEIYRTFRTIAFDDIDSFYQAFFDCVEGTEFGAAVSSALRVFDPDEFLAEFPFYTVADKNFRFVRDDVLGPASYDQVMELLMKTHHMEVESLRHDLWMNESHLRELAANDHVIGLHSYTHPTRLGEMPRSQQQEEYERNQKDLNDILDQEISTVSHPCNSYTKETLGILAGLGVQLGFRANMEDHRHSPFEYPREDHANIVKRLLL